MTVPLDEVTTPLDIPTDRSRALATRLRQSLPGGDTRSATYYAPFPLSLVRGEGCRVEDADGNRFIDLLNNFTALVHGHAPPAIIARLQGQAPLGTVFPAPAEAQAELAEAIRGRFASIELLRFTNSGSEAVMMAVRAARAATGRDAIVKIDGGYHGSWEQVPMTTNRSPSLRGIPGASLDLLHSVHYNDVDGLTAVMSDHGGEVAAVVIEPVMGEGVLTASGEFLGAARQLADEHGALLVFDEVISSRLDVGGRQGAVGVRPDLTALGKLIGGGLPVGAFGGRAEVMDAFDPSRPGNLEHSGTYNGNAMTMAAGCAALELLTAAEVERINRLGEALRAGLGELLAGSALDGSVTGCGSLVHVHFDADETPPLVRFSDLRLGSQTLRAFHRASLEEGIFFATRGLMCTSTAMDDAVVEELLGRFGRAITRVEQRQGW